MAERLRVLFITAWYPTDQHPNAGVFVQACAQAVQQFDDITVLHCAGLQPDLSQQWTVELETRCEVTAGIPTYRVAHRLSRVPKTSYFLYLWSVLQAFRRIARVMRPQLLHAHVSEAGMPAVLLGKLYHLPVVLSEHYSGFLTGQLTAGQLRRARLAMGWADRVLPVSAALQSAIAAYGIRSRSTVVPNVVDTRLFYMEPGFQQASPIKRIVFAGSLTPQKGLPFLLDALSQLAQDRNDWQLNVIGDGPARAEYEARVRTLGLADRVLFEGYCTKVQVATAMRTADLFVLPSLVETFSVVTAEALACGVPVLVTRCGGPEEFVNGDAGLIVPPGDSGALRQGLADMLAHLDAYPRDRIASRAAGRFGPEPVGARLDALYHELLRHDG